MKIDIEEVKPWLRLLSVQGVGPGLYRELLLNFGNPGAALSASLDALMALPRMDRETALAIQNTDEGWVASQINAAEREETTIITLEDIRYPSLLREIHAPPPILFIKGSHEMWKGFCVGVVGPRIASEYGKKIARMLTSGLAELGFTIVSGLARGIDTIAHQRTLERGGRTVAVLGCGTDVVYPSENQWLFEDISQSGAIVSEFPMGTKPEANLFPQRNRIISGMSLGVLIVEASVKSGALLTARHALEQGREVFAVPGPIDSENSQGANRLIKNGAKLVQGVQDVVEELQGNLRGMPSPLQAELPFHRELSQDETAVLTALSTEITHVDVIASVIGFPPGKTLGTLLSLELAGLAKQLPGKMFVRG